MKKNGNTRLDSNRGVSEGVALWTVGQVRNLPGATRVLFIQPIMACLAPESFAHTRKRGPGFPEGPPRLAQRFIARSRSAQSDPVVAPF
jgi:hypothetical protein